MLDDENPDQTADAAQPSAPRRRRAASRPAGPPQPRAELPAPEPAAELPAPEPLIELTAPEALDALPAPAPTGEPAADEPVVELPTPEPDTDSPAPEAAGEAADATARDGDGAALGEQVHVEPADEPAEPDVDTAPAAVAPRAKRTRTTGTRAPRTSRRSASAGADSTGETAAETGPSAPAPTPGLDSDLAASLEQLAAAPRPRRRTRARAAEAFGVDEQVSTDEVLGSLAAAIAGGGTAPEEPDIEEPAADVTTDERAAEVITDSSDAAVPDDSAPAEEPLADDEDEEAGEPEGPSAEARRRRRRRGGRRRRRGSADESAGDEDHEAESVGPEVAEGEPEPTDADAVEDAGVEGGTRRRRRRRRRGEDIGTAEDDPSDVVVRVREPRRTQRSTSDEVTGIEGSTRMEAKKQRRREGRAAGRRRAPILSESEFLARRESVDRRMLVRQADDYAQIAVLEDGILVEHYVDRASATSMIGNIYLGRIQNVLPSMEAAFVDIGRGRNAVLYAGEVDWDSYGVTGADKKVERVFKSGQTVLVQVSKDPVGAKGARLTSHISIPGRYIVYSPGGQLSGISRKLPENERKRLKDILDGLIGDHASVIVRTAAEGAAEDELVRDVNRLKAQWEVIEKKTKAGSAPQLLYAEPDLTVRIVRDLFTEDFGQLIVDGNGRADDAFDTVEAYVTHVAPHLRDRLVRWDRAASGDLFDAHRIHEQVAKALERKVFLPSGGSLIIDRTEAMTVVDVNTGKFTGTSGNLEATVTSNNLEAAEEIVRQLRLRDIGGIIVIDFIDMVLPSNRELLLRRLVECLGRDRTRHQVAEVTSLGLVQMTRKKIGTGLAEAFTVPCETCKGRGYHTHDVPVASQAPADGGDRDHGRRPGTRAPSRTRTPAAAKGEDPEVGAAPPSADAPRD